MRKSKIALLAATALGASLSHGAAAAVLASQPDAIVEDAARVPASLADEPEMRAVAAQRIGLIAVLIAAGGALLSLLGPKRVVKAVASGARVAASATVSAAKSAGGAVRKAVLSPLRTLLLVGGLAIFAFTGISLYDAQWVAGLAVGAALALLTTATWLKLKAALIPARARNAKKSVN